MNNLLRVWDDGPPSSTAKASDLTKGEELPFLNSCIELKGQNICVPLSLLMCNTPSRLKMDFFLHGSSFPQDVEEPNAARLLVLGFGWVPLKEITSVPFLAFKKASVSVLCQASLLWPFALRSLGQGHAFIRTDSLLFLLTAAAAAREVFISGVIYFTSAFSGVHGAAAD